ncbi:MULTISPECIES: FAD-dependent oxidoreductase [Symbiopectobacterium]|uniref:FAD-dependent oxidoreductase n=1 Tax=Symbiopectobacterium TaxID=801 RepID=UPI0020794288|nr:MULTISPECIES: FAD-dependent oxidoreductase [Symbiopectobacterium]MBT9430147.1 FAD-dependent oxidoreductase [Candidatus Symbiopectobacterium endolongispinus]
MIQRYDVIVIGGGIVGHAIAYGLQRQHAYTAILDGGDTDFRATRGNFGLIWVQGKGVNCPPYSQLSCLASTRWPDFAQRLRAETGIDCGLSQPGGINFFLTSETLTSAIRNVSKLQLGQPGFSL